MAEGRRWRIMIVDDELELLSPIFDCLQREFETVGAVNGLDALEKLDRYEPDLIILDVMIPGIDGIDTCRAIRRNVRFGHTPVVLISGYDEARFRSRIKNLGIVAFVRKPIQPTALLEICRETIRQQNESPPPKHYTVDQLITPPPDEFDSVDLEAPDAATAAPAGRSVESAETLQALAAPPEPAAFAIAPRILVIDDDRDAVARALAVLAPTFETFGCIDPVAAIEQIIRCQPDLVFVAATMPRLSGFQLSQLVRMNRNLRGTKIVFMSANNDPLAVAYARKLGGAGYLVKPFESDELLRRVLTIIDSPDFAAREKAIPFDVIRRAEQKEPSPFVIF